MPAAFYILFGAGLTVASCWALGVLLLRRLALPLYRGEEGLLGFVAGSACLSAIMFLLSTVRLVHKGVVLALGVAILTAGFRAGIHRARGLELAPLPRFWKFLFVAVFGAFSYLYFFHAMAPEMSPDGMAYHLATVSKYYHAHGFVRITTNIYANLSQGVELLFLFAFAFGRHSAGALVHYSFLVCGTLLMLAYGRRIGFPRAGVAGALFFYASPVIGQDGTVAYIDVALATVLFSVFYFLQIWLEQPGNTRALVPVGILSGFAYATKYTGLLAVPYALGIVTWTLWRLRKPILRPAFVTAMLAFLFIAPWMIKNWIWVADPVSPFANRLFPNQYVHVSFEDDWRKYERLYGLTSYWQIPLQLTVDGNLLTGLFGPLFLLTPLSLLSLRFRAGRQLLLAGAVFALPYSANIGSRFLIPAAPFLSLGIALAFANLNWLLAILAIAHALSCWPSVLNKYCGQYAWRLSGKPPVKAALRIVPEQKYLTENSSEYNMARTLERLTPPGERVFAFTQTGESYTSREVLSRYTAALNERIGDMLWTPLFDGMQPTRIVQLSFAPRATRQIRVVQTERCPSAMWSVAELRVYRGGKELPRRPQWRLKARPNPWDVQLAFDNSAVTRWRSWQVAEPGMYLQIDFGQPETIDQVTLEISGEDHETKMRLEAAGAAVRAQVSETERPVTGSLRWPATREVERLGIHYVLVRKDDLRADDFSRYAPLWGLKCIAEAGDARLYHIE